MPAGPGLFWNAGSLRQGLSCPLPPPTRQHRRGTARTCSAVPPGEERQVCSATAAGDPGSVCCSAKSLPRETAAHRRRTVTPARFLWLCVWFCVCKCIDMLAADEISETRQEYHPLEFAMVRDKKVALFSAILDPVEQHSGSWWQTKQNQSHPGRGNSCSWEIPKQPSC